MGERCPPVEVRVWGDFACFTRPEMKVERVTYPLCTPSAARGILEAIFWKPQFRWRIEEIAVLKPIRYFSILRNEVNHRASDRVARRFIAAGGGYDATDRKNRAQRHSLVLRDVDYLIRGSVDLKPGVEDDVAKFRDQLRRRVRRGRCFAMPYLGCREFSAFFAEPDGNERPIDQTFEVGRMLLDLDYDPDGSGRGTPVFFEAGLEQGRLRVPKVQETRT